MRDFMGFIGRLGNATMDIINRIKAKNAADNIADTIANGGIVRESEQSFSDLAAKPGVDKDE